AVGPLEHRSAGEPQLLHLLLGGRLLVRLGRPDGLRRCLRRLGELRFLQDLRSAFLSHAPTFVFFEEPASAPCFAPAGVSQPCRSGCSPRAIAMYRSWIRVVIGPRLPAPIG